MGFRLQVVRSGLGHPKLFCAYSTARRYVVPKIGEGEGKVDHVSCETCGFVTDGKGKMLPDATSASELAFPASATDIPAPDEEIRAGYDLIVGIEAKQSRRGKTERIPDGTPVFASVHPSYIL